MTREEYLSALKNEIMALTTDEQSEALQYYSDYFEEADDDEKVMEELGTPAELAKVIIENLANAVVVTEKESSSSDEDDESYYEDNLYYTFKTDCVKSLDMDFGMANVVLVGGSNFSVETRGLSREDLKCHTTTDGTLIICNTRRVPFSFFSHNRSQRFIPRILITVPDNITLDKFNLQVGAGQFKSKECGFKCNSGRVSVGAGNMELNGIYGGSLNFRVGMGNLTFDGSVTGRSDIDCGMGNLKLNLEGNPLEYTYDLRLGLGEFKINDEKKSGVCQENGETKKKNHFSVNCGMGAVNIKIKKNII